MSICDEVTVLHYGEIITTGDPATVQADPAVQAAYLGTENVGPSETPEHAVAARRAAARRSPARRFRRPSPRPCWS